MKLQIYMIEKECAQLTDVIGHVISLMLDLYLENIISRSLFACVCACICIRDDVAIDS